MKFNSSFKSILLLILALCSVEALAEQNPKIVPAAFSKMYVPEGFDSNDNVQVVGTGIFPNSCYRNAETKFRIDSDSKRIYFWPLAYKYPGICLEVIMPFDRVVNLGPLAEGKYTLIQAEGNYSIGELNVRAARFTEPDDTLYAPISQAYLQPGVGGDKVYLTGEFPLSCMRLKEINYQIQPDVLVILPIAMIDKNVPCVQGKFPFDAVKEVGEMKPGVYLLHVRSMNGKAINNLFRIR